MPVFPDEPRYIDSQTQLDTLCEELTGNDILGLDTEFVRTDTYFPKLCLIQAAASSSLVCIDVLAEIDSAPFTEQLTDDKTLKVFHAAKQDLEAFYSVYDRLPTPIFDTQIGAGLLGYQAQIGYAGLVEELLGITLDKGQTRTDWARRPLSTAQIQYAADDVRYLDELYMKLRDGLEAAGRYTWALEDSIALVDPGLYVLHPDDAWRRLPSIAYLELPQQARARCLTAWRERRAKSSNRPRGWILSDKALLAIADADPQNEAALAEVPHLPAGVRRKQGRAILSELDRANKDVSEDRVDFDQLPESPRPSPETLKKLAGIVSDRSKELNIVPELLATRRDLADLVRGDRDIRPLTGWRREVIGETLLESL